MGLVLVLWLGAILPAVSPQEDESKQNLWSAKVTLLTPVLPKPVQRPASLPVPKLQLQRPKPTLEAPKIIEIPKSIHPKPVAPPVVAKARIPVPEPPRLQPVSPPAEVARPTLPKWEPKVQVGAFKDSTTASANLKLPPSRVQTGGFGSPSGVPGFVQGGSHGNVAHLGAFDMPTGPGSGNGSGGAHGTQGRVASSGFGDGIAAAPSQGVPGGGQVAPAPSGFADARSLTHSAPQAQPHQTSESFDPVQILSKPNPVYTEEARRLHVQGEVLLRVVFAASGKLQILGVTRGLGHGLDQAAVQAAQQIEFKLARRNGQPEDTTATLHILFELAA
jgi:TonB family protein